MRFSATHSLVGCGSPQKSRACHSTGNHCASANRPEPAAMGRATPRLPYPLSSSAWNTVNPHFFECGSSVGQSTQACLYTRPQAQVPHSAAWGRWWPASFNFDHWAPGLPKGALQTFWNLGWGQHWNWRQAHRQENPAFKVPRGNPSKQQAACL